MLALAGAALASASAAVAHEGRFADGAASGGGTPVAEARRRDRRGLHRAPASADGDAPDPATRPFHGDPPGDPYEAVPPMAAPFAQPEATARRRLADDLARAPATRRRIAFSVLPLYAAAVLRLAGRDRFVFHGGGAAAEVDVPIVRNLWLRVFGQVSGHPLRESLEREDDDVKVTAPSGTLAIYGGTAGLAYALDVSRMMAILDVGLGLSWLRTPKGVRDGQRGMPCSAGGACDPGLACTAAGICEMRPASMAAAGLSAEWLVGRHASVGITVRYYAFVTNLQAFPVYLVAAARWGIRF
ncbi:MAG: hypothetical protein D6705_00925 [Deltaproteobacteria bacterium]|nr:MAG: hypothetical protein D6705_00925 [Deltaproteobacteria bacterium]